MIVRRRRLRQRDEFVRGQDPIHRNGVTSLRRTTQSQRSISPCSIGYLNLPTVNNFTANETEPLVIQRMPFPKLIEPPQNIQSICIGQCVRGGKAHEKTYTPAGIGRTIRRAADLPIGENLMVAARCSRNHPIPATKNHIQRHIDVRSTHE